MSDRQRQLEKAARVRASMLDGVLGEALADVEADYTRALLDCHDAAERERLWLAVQVVRKVKAQFASAEGAAIIGERQVQEMRRLHAAR